MPWHPMQWSALQISQSKNTFIVFDWSRVIVGRSLNIQVIELWKRKIIFSRLLLVDLHLPEKNGDNTWHEQRDKQSITTKISGLRMKYRADIWWTQANHSWACSIPLFDPDLWDAFSGFCNLKRPWGKEKKKIYIYIYKYYERKKGRNYISRQACFVNRFTLQGFNERIFIWLSFIY